MAGPSRDLAELRVRLFRWRQRVQLAQRAVIVVGAIELALLALQAVVPAAHAVADPLFVLCGLGVALPAVAVMLASLVAFHRLELDSLMLRVEALEHELSIPTEA